MRVDVAPARDLTRWMKTATFFTALLAMLVSTGGVFGKHKPPPPNVVDLSSHSATNAPATTNTFLVTPDDTVSGRVIRVNENLRFVVLRFPLGQVPAPGTRMNVFRNGAIVGEIKVTGPQRDENSIADIVLGDAQKGDEVRPR